MASSAPQNAPLAGSLPRSRSRVHGFRLLLGLWAIALIGGTTVLARHAGTPGRPATRSPELPAGLVACPAGPTLVMALHPLCPCSHASLQELETLLDHASRWPVQRPMTTYVLFVELSGQRADATPLWQKAAAIRGVQPVRDSEGIMTRQLAAETSGQTYLFGPDGGLLFSGGITAARAHVGDNAGRAALETLLRHPTRPSVPATTAVFGCGLVR